MSHINNEGNALFRSCFSFGPGKGDISESRSQNHLFFILHTPPHPVHYVNSQWLADHRTRAVSNDAMWIKGGASTNFTYYGAKSGNSGYVHAAPFSDLPVFVDIHTATFLWHLVKELRH